VANDAISIETRHRSNKLHTCALHSSQTTEIEMNTVIAALLSNQRLASQTHSRRRSELIAIIAFSLIAVLAVLYMATHYPPPEGIYTELMTTT
jgi:hypothetical protein